MKEAIQTTQDRFSLFNHSLIFLFSLRVKPAIFDLLLAVCIAAYLGIMYLAIQNFGVLYSVVRRVTQPKAKTH